MGRYHIYIQHNMYMILSMQKHICECIVCTRTIYTYIYMCMYIYIYMYIWVLEPSALRVWLRVPQPKNLVPAASLANVGRRHTNGPVGVSSDKKNFACFRSERNRERTYARHSQIDLQAIFDSQTKTSWRHRATAPLLLLHTPAKS